MSTTDERPALFLVHDEETCTCIDCTTAGRGTTRHRWVWGEGVRALRGMLQLSLEDLAGLAHTTPHEVERLEAGARDVSFVVAVGIARVLNVDPLHLFWFNEYAPESEPRGW